MKRSSSYPARHIYTDSFARPSSTVCDNIFSTHTLTEPNFLTPQPNSLSTFLTLLLDATGWRVMRDPWTKG